MTGTEMAIANKKLINAAMKLEKEGEINLEGIGMKGMENSVSKVQTFPYKGILNKTAFPEFVNICKMSQKSLKRFLCKKMKETYPETTFIGDGYIFCKGEIPVLLTAHMDTVHDKLIKNFYEDVEVDKDGNTKHIISSPQGIGGDDRCGIYEILTVLEDGYRPYILFCEDEEIGGKGSAKFCKTEYIKDLLDLKFLIELDRANANDLVFYSNDNKKFIEWIEDETNWEMAWGSFSDICNLSPECGVSSVNLSCGYYKAHTVFEYVVVEEMLEAIEVVKHLLDASEKVNAFEYVEKKSSWRNFWSNSYGYGYFNRGYNYDDYDDYDKYYNSYNYYENKTDRCQLEIIYISYDNSEEGEEMTEVLEGTTEADCWASFFKEHIYVCYADVLDYYVSSF